MKTRIPYILFVICCCIIPFFNQADNSAAAASVDWQIISMFALRGDWFQDSFINSQDRGEENFLPSSVQFQLQLQSWVLRTTHLTPFPALPHQLDQQRSYEATKKIKHSIVSAKTQGHGNFFMIVGNFFHILSKKFVFNMFNMLNIIKLIVFKRKIWYLLVSCFRLLILF